MKPKNIIASVILLATTSLLVNCQIRIESDTNSNDRYFIVDGLLSRKRIVGSEATCTTTIRDLKTFENIRIDGCADMEFQQSADGKTEVTVIVAENLADLAEITSEHSTLRVGYAEKYNKIGICNSRLKIIVSNPQLSCVLINGSGDIQLKGDVYSKELSLNINGSSDINAHSLSCEELKVLINGSGDVTLAGKADNAILIVNGSGDIDAEDLLCKKVRASVTGSGDIDCYAAETLDANVTGSGEISYRGDAKVAGKNIKRK